MMKSHQLKYLELLWSDHKIQLGIGLRVPSRVHKQQGIFYRSVQGNEDKKKSPQMFRSFLIGQPRVYSLGPVFEFGICTRHIFSTF